MDQSQSSSVSEGTEEISREIVLPKRKFSMEFFVGLFTVAALAAAGYLAVGLGGVTLWSSDEYYVYAEFDNVSGLKYGASVEVAGVKVGDVVNITLEDPMAIVQMKLVDSFRLRDDDIAAIRTKGIIGDRYVKISRGASDLLIPKNGRLTETESVVDIEDIIGKIVHSLGADDEE